MPLDPAARGYLDELAAVGAPPIWEAGIDETRRDMDAAAPALAPFEDVDSVEDTTAGSVPVRVYQPAAASGVLVWFHGGGWVTGSLATHDGVLRQLANRAQCTVVAADYRLAPEHPYPAAVEDAWEATTWATARFDTVAVGGDSAGGALATVAALRARDASLPLALQVLVYPALDHSFDTISYEECATGFGLTRESMEWYWQQYLGPDGDGAHPEASPLRASDLSGIAPALVVTAEYDPLRDEAEAYAERLQQAGVRVTLRRYDGQIHGFFRMTQVFPAGRALLEELAATLRRELDVG
jgi:acetyl esterase